MALTLEAEQRLADVGVVKFYGIVRFWTLRAGGLLRRSDEIWKPLVQLNKFRAGQLSPDAFALFDQE